MKGLQNIQIDTLVKNIMGQTGVNDPNEAIRLVNSGEWTLENKPVEQEKNKEEPGLDYLLIIFLSVIGIIISFAWMAITGLS